MGKKVIHGGLILRATLASGSGHDLLTVNPSTGEVGSISGTPLTTTLTAGSIFLGNASNVATATAMSGDVTINSSGVTAIEPGVIVNADINATAAIAHSKMAALTASRALVSDGSGVVSASSVTSTQIGYLSTTTSDVQTQLNGKQATITGAATTITSSNLTANRALISGTLGKVEVSSVTNTELGYIAGLTSSAQTQINSKLSATISGASTGDIIYFNGTNWVNLPKGTDGQTLRSSSTTILWDTPTINGIPVGGDAGQVLSKNSGTDFDADWSTLSVSSITDLTASAAELNLLDGVTASTTEINYLDGVTSNIQSQLGNKLSNSLPHNAIFVGNISNIAASLAAGSEGQILSISSGTPTWTTISASGVTIIAGLDGTTKSANGGAISGVNLYLQTADDTYPGLVSTGAQTFAGAKTFTSTLLVTPSTGVYSTFNTVNSGSGYSRYDYSGTPYGYVGQGSGLITAGSDTDFVVRAENNLLFAISSSEAARLTSTGLGIGITPTTKLHVDGIIKSEAGVSEQVLNNGGSISNLHQFNGIARDSSGHQVFQVIDNTYNNIWRAGTSTTTSNELMRLTGAGLLGIGVTPTAKLHLPAGTASSNTAPLKFTTGTALTTPEDGALEYHSSHLYFTIGSTRYQLDQQVSSTLTSGTYSPTLFGVTNVSAGTPQQAQYMRVGNVVTVSGRISSLITGAAGITRFGLTLPIASNFTASENAGGTAMGNDGTFGTLCINADSVNDRVTVSGQAPSADTWGSISYHFTYLIQ